MGSCKSRGRVEREENEQALDVLQIVGIQWIKQMPVRDVISLGMRGAKSASRQYRRKKSGSIAN